MLVLLAKLTNKEMVGLLTLARAITFPPLQFANLNLRIVLASTTTGDFRFREYLGLRLFALPIAFAFIVFAGFSGRTATEGWIVVLVGLAGVFDSISDVIYGVFQQTENLDRISISRTIQGLGQLVVFVLVMLVTKNLLMGVGALAVMSALVTIFYDLRLARVTLHQARAERDVRYQDEESLSLKPSFEAPRLYALFLRALPMAVVLLFTALIYNVPRYFIESSFGLAELGIFGAMTALMQAAAMVQSAVGHSTVPRLARYYEEDAGRFKRLFRKLVGISVISMVANVVGSLLLGKWALSVIYKPEYAAQIAVFHWLMLANGIYYVQAALKDGVTAAQNYRVQPWILGLGVGSVALACIPLIPSHGLLGAAWAVTIGMTLMAVLFAVVALQTIRRLPTSTAQA